MMKYLFKMRFDLPVGKKKCPKCKAVKDVEEFAKRSDTVDGREGYCKPCRREIANAYANERKKDRKLFEQLFFNL